MKSFTVLSVALASLANVCSAASSSNSSMASQFQNLSSVIALPGSSAYSYSLSTYFSQQEQQIYPAVIVIPSTTQQVSAAVSIISQIYRASNKSFQFALRGGGKGPWYGIANIPASATIDMSKFNTTTISSDRKTVVVGAGSKWGDVYATLVPAGLAIAGGRDSTVGVAGLTVGGGMSFFGPQTGWVCDSVINFEVVLANGSVVNASPTSNSDLFRALKGGANNLGLVTRYTFNSFPFGQLWGGQTIYAPTTAPQHLDAIYNFTAATNPDPYATVIQSFALYQGLVIIVEGLHYMQPVVNPPVFQPFTSIQPQLSTTNRLTDLLNATIEQSGFNVNGLRQGLITTTFVNDRNVLQYAFDQWTAKIPNVVAVQNISWSITFQPLPQDITQASQKSGGNVLGLEGVPNLMLAQIAITWGQKSDDSLVIGSAQSVINQIDQYSTQNGKFNRFKYLNYAAPNQSVIAGYGPSNVNFLKGVSQKYDPYGLFQGGLPGGFKLNTA